MESYLRRNRLSELLDGIGLMLLMWSLAVMWFTWLWGLQAASLLAGTALGMLLWTARYQWRRRTVERREKALRSRIGAELMLEEMMLETAVNAHRQSALLLAQRWPVKILRAEESGALCRQGEETLLIRCLRQMPESELSAGDLLAAQRAVRSLQADRGVLCVLGKVSAKMAARAEQSAVPLRIIRRETLLALAGVYAPATDAQLVELGRRSRRSAGQGSLVRRAFRREKARRYHLYGTSMLCLYLLAGIRIYAVAGMVCLTMAVLSCVRPAAQEQL